MSPRLLISCGMLALLFVAGCATGEPPRPADPQRPATEPRSGLTAVDDASGIVLRVDDGGRVVSATDNAGHVLWAVDVIDKAGPPAVGKPIIRHLSLVNGEVSVVYGKHSFASFDLKTGTRLSSGSD
jgi:hypothetical protein